MWGNKMKKTKRNFLTSCRYKVLVASMTALTTILVATSVAQASDIEIYQNAKSGDITLMFLLDISNSMNTTDTGTTGTRTERLKTAMTDLLQGNTNKGITKLDDNKIIGLSTLGYLVNNTQSNSNYRNTGAILIPARKLSEKIGNKTQRQLLIDTIKGLVFYTNTPTARSYAETISYLMGTTTATRKINVTKMPYYRSYKYDTKENTGTSWNPNWVTTSHTVIQKCTSWNNSYSDCGSGGWTTSSDTIPSGSHIEVTNCNFSVSGVTEYEKKCYSYTGEVDAANANSGFQYSSDETKNTTKTLYASPSSLVQDSNIQQCSGQGVYVLTDGDPTEDSDSEALMKSALGAYGDDFSCDNTTWGCIGALTSRLISPTGNPKGLKFKTAVVGFGNSFNSVASYDKTKDQAENIRLIQQSKASKNQIEAALWGVKAEGGWYSGKESSDIVDSVNDFISNLSKDIPSVTTGSPVVPKDALNPAELQDDAYYQTFQPTPNTNYQLWLGNLKKYKVSDSGTLIGKNNNKVFDKDGSIIQPKYDEKTQYLTSAVYDFWAPSIVEAVKNGDENTQGSSKFAAKGGVWANIVLGANEKNIEKRKIYTNRKANNSNFVSSGQLRQIHLSDLTDATYKQDANRGYILSLLGYKLDVINPPTTIDNLIAQPSLRQIGAVMHSEPVLVTNKGKISYNAKNQAMESTGREDYVLFGTTQGLLHVVDAETGVEKFVFLPNEMVENQKDAFRSVETTNGGMQKLYYGIDGPWSLDTRYVVDEDGYLVVGKGKGTNQQGRQVAYGGLRMGGRSYYALDLSDIDNPELKFHIDPANSKVHSGTKSNFFSPLAFMGQSWSKPTITSINWGGARKRVMFVGGGYDAGGTDGDARTNGVKGLYAGYENSDYNQTNKIGAGVYMFDADNGDLLWWTSANADKTSASDTETGVIATKSDDLKYSVVSEIRAVDRDGDDLVDNIYFGDLGGQLFRVDFDNKQNIIGAVAKTPVKLLDINNNVNNRSKGLRFYETPAFSLYNKKGTTFAVVSIGSGNRSKPLQDYTSSDADYNYDAIYNIYDQDIARRDLFTNRKMKTENLTTLNLGEITDTNRFSNTTLVADLGVKNGWYYKFQNCTAGVDGTIDTCSSYKKQSEKVYGKPLVMNYQLYVSTFDASKPGISGDCGAGVKGESMITAFCMPYGQCKSQLAYSRDVLGVGIHTITVGGKKNSLIDDNKEDCTGEDCPVKECEDDLCPPKAIGESSANNYCIETSGRIALTVAGGFGNGEATKMCLIPQRWYEKLVPNS